MTLAMEGGAPIITTPIKPRRSITAGAAFNVQEYIVRASHGEVTLSGYLAGSQRGGSAVQRLEDMWCAEFGVGHAVACNSGTSALLAACHAAGVRRTTTVWVPTMGMSAAAAAPKFLGGKVRFVDVDQNYHLAPEALADKLAIGDVVIAVNLFGRPCRLQELRTLCDRACCLLIEDACQSLWATVDGQRAGTIGHIGCFSMNVHKPLNCGEGGMLITKMTDLARRARGFINHGECGGPELTSSRYPGLNLRMTELTAVLAMSQFMPSKRIVEQMRAIAKTITKVTDNGVLSDHYCLPILAPTERARDQMVKALNAEGLPCVAGYMLMHRLPAFIHEAVSSANHHDLEKAFPTAEDLNKRLLLVELCSLDPTEEQIGQMAQAIDTVWKSLW